MLAWNKLMRVCELACASTMLLGLPLAAYAQMAAPNPGANTAAAAASSAATGYSGIPAGVINGSVAATLGPDTTSGTPSGVAPAPTAPNGTATGNGVPQKISPP